MCGANCSAAHAENKLKQETLTTYWLPDPNAFPENPIKKEKEFMQLKIYNCIKLNYEQLASANTAACKGKQSES